MKKRILIISLIITLFCSNISADTNVGGVIASNTTLTIANSPYIVTDNIVVLANLTIESGVEVRFNTDFQLRVASSGSFSVNGNINDSVIFTSNNTSPSVGDWNQILIDQPTSEIIFNYAKISYANKGINIINSFALIKIP